MKKEPLHKLPEKNKTWLSLAQCPLISQQSQGTIALTKGPWQFNSFQQRSPGYSTFCFHHMSPQWMVTVMKSFQLRVKQQSYRRPGILSSEAARQSGRDSLRGHHTPTVRWGDSGRPRSGILLIHMSGRLTTEVYKVRTAEVVGAILPDVWNILLPWTFFINTPPPRCDRPTAVLGISQLFHHQVMSEGCDIEFSFIITEHHMKHTRGKKVI